MADLTPDQLMLSLGLRSIMRERGLDPQEDAALKQALPPFLRHASVVRVGKAQVGGGLREREQPKEMGDWAGEGAPQEAAKCGHCVHPPCGGFFLFLLKVEG